MKFISIKQDGTPAGKVELTDALTEVCKQTRGLYQKEGFVSPWVGYLMLIDDVVVGTCSFKSPPKENRVEIAYFTFPENEGKGYGTEMAKFLVATAKKEMPDIQIIAQTLLEDNASTTILRKMGFAKARQIKHPEDGLVQEWELE